MSKNQVNWSSLQTHTTVLVSIRFYAICYSETHFILAISMTLDTS